MFKSRRLFPFLLFSFIVVSAVFSFFLSNVSQKRVILKQKAAEEQKQFTNSQNTSVGTYFSGYARWAKSTGWWTDEQISLSIDSQAAAFHSVGAKWAREDMPWFSIEKTQGVFDWGMTGGATDMAISKYNTDDSTIAILEQTPGWASSDPNGANDHRYPDSDPNLSRWIRYISETVGRYKNKVKYWEIWNEADISQDPQNPSTTFIPKPGQTVQQSYFNLLKAAYTTIKNVDPSAKVLINAFGSWNISGSLNNPLIGDSMVNYIMNQPHQMGDGWPYFDIFNIHVYSQGDPAVEIQRTKTLLSHWPQTTNMPIWITETNPMNYLKSPPQPGLPTPPPGGNTVDNASAVMSWWLNRQMNEGVDKILWFTLLNWQCDQGAPDCTNFITAGLNKILDFSNQSTWYTMRELLLTPTPTPTQRPTPTPTPTLRLLHQVDQPQPNVSYSSPFEFAGWTIWEDGQKVQKVEFYMDLPKEQVGKYGEALTDQFERPDLCRLNPLYCKAGWKWRFNPAWVNNGPHKVYVYAHDSNRGYVGNPIVRDFTVAVSPIPTPTPTPTSEPCSTRNAWDKNKCRRCNVSTTAGLFWSPICTDFGTWGNPAPTPNDPGASAATWCDCFRRCRPAVTPPPACHILTPTTTPTPTQTV